MRVELAVERRRVHRHVGVGPRERGNAFRGRHQGEQGDIAAQDTPIGAVLPAFTVHSLRGSAVLFQRGANRTSILLSVENLTNELYAEFSNATFFRPEARRNVQAAIVVEF